MDVAQAGPKKRSNAALDAGLARRHACGRTTVCGMGSGHLELSDRATAFRRVVAVPINRQCARRLRDAFWAETGVAIPSGHDSASTTANGGLR